MSKDIRVALSGSGFKFPVHVGALLAIRDAGYTPIEYAGTSGGSIIASLAASGMSLEMMKALALTNDWSSMLTASWMSMLTGKGYCDGQYLYDWIESNTSNKKFKDCVPLVIMSSDITNAKPFRWSKDTTPDSPVALAARASASIPFVYVPVQHNGVYSVDGGVENNLPVLQLIQDTVPRIGIDLVSKDSTLTSMSPAKVGARLLNMMLGAAESTQALFSMHTGAQIAYIETGYASGLDRNMDRDTRTKLFNDGYKGTSDILSKM